MAYVDEIKQLFYRVSTFLLQNWKRQNGLVQFDSFQKMLTPIRQNNINQSVSSIHIMGHAWPSRFALVPALKKNKVSGLQGNIFNPLRPWGSDYQNDK